MRLPWLVLVAACGSADSTIDLTHDVCSEITVAAGAASDAQRAAIDHAIELWRGRGVHALARAEPGLTRGARPSLAVVFEDASAAIRGHYDDEHGIVYINARITDPEPLAIVIAHELGHAFGLVHGAAPSVMESGNLATPPTEVDQRTLEALWGPCE